MRRDDIISAFTLSLQLALVTAFMSALLGLMAALGLQGRGSRGAEIIRLMILSPLIVPGVVFGIGLLIFLSNLGVIGSFPTLVAAHVCITLPYVVRTVSAGLDGVDES